MLGAVGLAFADGAAPDIPFFDNPIAVFSAGMLLLSVLLAPVPRLFRWDWRSQYFGMTALLVGSVGLLGLIPLLCIVLFGSLPRGLSWSFLLLEVGLVVWWCRRFVVLYRRVFAETNLFRYVYQEETDALYYLQRADNLVLEKLKFSQTPPNLTLFIPVSVAFLLVPFMSSVAGVVGTPFVHVFLAVFSIPIVLWSFGLATRGYLVFYYFPWKLKRATGKNVYVDMATEPGTVVSTSPV